jgi:Tyrosine phosphatase family
MGVRTLVQEDYPAENLAFLESAGIKFFQFPIPGNKEPFVVIPDTSVIGALETILDKRNHPILVHCNAGKVRPPKKHSPYPPNIFPLFYSEVSVVRFVGRLTL